MTDERHSAAEKITRNLPGIEKRQNKLLLRGVGLLEKENGCYGLSKEAIGLTQAYTDNPEGKEWVYVLSRLLLLREPRVRALVGLLSEDGAELVFTGNECFTASLRKSMVCRQNQQVVYPFTHKDNDVRTLRDVLQERAWWTLGAWRDHPLLDGAEDCIYVGQMSDQFSLHDIGLALHAACEVLLHAGILKSTGNVCTVDQSLAAEIMGDAMAEGFGWTRKPRQAAPLLTLIQSLLNELRTDTGFVVASELRAALAAQGIENPDKEIAALEKAGTLIVYAEDYGQSRHGAGLYGDPRKQLVKIRLVMGGK